MTHYVIVAVNGSRTMRLGQVFNETVIYARQWVTVDTAKWWPLPGRRPTLRIMKHCQEMAHWWVYEEGQHVLLYQFTFRFHQYTAGTDSLAFSSASTVTVNPYCRCFTCKAVIYWSGSGFFLFFLSVSHPKESHTLQYTCFPSHPHGPHGRWRSAGQNMQRSRTPTNPIRAI